LGAGEKQRVDGALRRHRVAVERDDGEAVAGKRERDVLGRTGIEQPEQHALAFADANGLAMAEHLVVEGCRFVEDLESVVGRRTLSQILHADPRAVPMVRGEQHFLVIAAAIAGRLDNQKAVHAGIEAARQIRPGNIVTVIPARARGPRRERVALRAAPLHHRRAFLHRAVGLRGQVEAMPVHDIVDVGVVADIDADLAAFPQPQDRTGHGAVVTERVDHPARRKLEPQRRDAQRMIRRARDLRVGGSEARPQRHPRRPRAEQEAATIDPRGRGELIGHPVSPFKCWTVRPAPKVWNASPFHVQFRMAMDSKKAGPTAVKFE
jgi:hypothetical protein